MGGKIKADYIFLSPPWGGVEYKESETYSIKEMMKPNIFDIVKVCFSIAKNIIFYLPRTLILEDLFEIINTCLPNEKNDILYLDIHILYSANKIKAVMLVFGNDVSKISMNQICSYVESKYRGIANEQTFELENIIKVIGFPRFLKNEIKFKANCKNKESNYKFVEKMTAHFKEKIMNTIDLNKLKLLEALQNYERVKKENKLKTNFFISDKIEDSKYFEEDFKIGKSKLERKIK